LTGEWSVQSTDMTTDSVNDGSNIDHMLRSTRVRENEDVQPFQEMPTKRDVQASIDTIRNWVMFSESECHDDVHTALSLIENFMINQREPGPDKTEPEPEPESSESENFMINNHYDPSEAPEPESSEILQDSVSNHVIIFHPPGSVLIDCIVARFMSRNQIMYMYNPNSFMSRSMCPFLMNSMEIDPKSKYLYLTIQAFLISKYIQVE